MQEISIKKFAERVHMHPGSIRRLIREGKIKGRQLYDERNAPWRIPEGEAVNFDIGRFEPPKHA